MTNVDLSAIEQIQHDFVTANGPFSNKEELLPERAALDDIPLGQHVDFLSYGVSLDYNRNAAQLWDNCLELREHYGEEMFDPLYVTHVEMSRPTLVSNAFDDIGFRYPNRDAKGWQENSQLLVDEFDGSWERLIEEAKSRHGAPSLVELLREHDFTYIKGHKLAPFYAKVIHENVTRLDNIWELDIPVDTHIRSLTQELANDNTLSNDDVRSLWRDLGKRHGVEPLVVDGGLWIIGNQWDEGGKEYFNDVRA